VGGNLARHFYDGCAADCWCWIRCALGLIKSGKWRVTSGEIKVSEVGSCSESANIGWGDPRCGELRKLFWRADDWRRSFFEPCYSQNPLVNALALGIARKEDYFSGQGQGAR